MEKTCGHAALLDVNLVMRPYHLFRKAWSIPMRKRAALQCCRIPIRCCYQAIYFEKLQAYQGESLSHAVTSTVNPVLLPGSAQKCICSECRENEECTIPALANYRRCSQASQMQQQLRRPRRKRAAMQCYGMSIRRCYQTPHTFLYITYSGRVMDAQLGSWSVAGAAVVHPRRNTNCDAQ